MWDWLGYYTNFNGVKPECCSDFKDIIYDNSSSGIPNFQLNLNYALGNFSLNQLDIALLYLPDGDDFGHKYGPNSKELADKVKQIDKDVVGHLINQLENFHYKNGSCKLKDMVDTVIFSDHGMATFDKDCLVDLEHIINNQTLVRHVQKSSTLYHIWPMENYKEEIVKELEKVDNITVLLKKDESKNNYHYRKNSRIAPDKYNKGDHGFDPYVTSNRAMNGIFYAFGPSIRKNIQLEPFRNVEIYQLLCSLTGLTCVKSSSTHFLATNVLKVERVFQLKTFLVLLICIGALMCIAAVGVIIYHRKRSCNSEYSSVKTDENYPLS
ncbi:DgyrCDS2053 [Dimorphilus gyrociliatus]|uniref:DgyrCDS2053 n=1 Tax=Dimorphilus gyrociliatus TaxID=2664684 RepID=A0A7I8VB29_9ANNE|nr:DgyrCDS2053 [Dimorphilus gyrociliatus]